MGENGRAFVEGNYDRRVLARKYLGVLEKIRRLRRFSQIKEK